MLYACRITPKMLSWQKDNLHLAERLEEMIPAIKAYLGEPPSYFGDDDYDPHREVRG